MEVLMARINAVLGPLDPADLGFTLMHEHVVTASAGIWGSYPELLGDRARLTRLAVDALSEARAAGIRTIVDVTTVDLGRNIELLAEVSERSGVHIIAATGAWRDIPRAFYLRPPDDVAEVFIREIEEGIDGTGIRAGIIKVANDQEGVTPEGEVILRAAARAARRTGVCISTHTYAPGRVGEQQMAVFEDEGLDPGQVYIGHSNDTTDLEYLLGLCRRGCYLGLDRYPGGRGDAPGWEERTDTAKRLLDAGAGGRVMLSHDWAVLYGHHSSDPEENRRRNPDGYLFISRKVLPRLRDLGATEAQVQDLMVETPRRFLGRTG
jgi:phosphotriesterase-related protein